MQKIVIVGGVAGGASAAARARRLSENAEIVMLERGPHISFANCGLPYHIGGEIKRRESLLLQTPQSFKARFNVDVRVNHEVTAIDRELKQVTVKNRLSQETYTLEYDKLLLSPGAAPIVPPIKGVDNPLTFSLRNIPDMNQIIESIEIHKPRHATVVGGGFIGIEMAEALRHRGLKVALVELSNQVMAPVDPEIAAFLHRELKVNGVDLRLGDALQEVSCHHCNTHLDYASGEGLDDAAYDPADEPLGLLTLQLSSGATLCTDLLIMAVGVTPDAGLAENAGLNLGQRGGILVDERMTTSDPNIYAVGDAVEDIDFVTDQSVLVPLAGPANRQGRIAADNMFGLDNSYRKTQGTAICKVFDLTVANTGQNEKTLAHSSIDYEKVYVHTASHAGYYPGAHPVTLKLLFDNSSGLILGAQAVGKVGIDKRIDVLAVAQRAGMTVYDLQELELCYAPPFGSAKDVVNQAGFVASNVLKGDVGIFHFDDVSIGEKQLLLDVRNPAEIAKLGSIPGAINIPVDQLRARMGELPKDREILAYCQVGLRGYVACRQLIINGYRAKNLSGGYRLWCMASRHSS